MPLCWIFLLKRRRALSNVSFSPTRTSANRCSPPPTRVSRCPCPGARPTGQDSCSTEGRQSRRSLPEGPGWVKRRSEGGKPLAEGEDPVRIDGRYDRPEADDER